MKNPLLLLALAAFAIPAFAAEPGEGWVSLYDGKSLDGWKASDEPGTFQVQNGDIIVYGKRSHLYYVGDIHNHDWKNFELKCDVMTRKGANSGVYFHTAWQEVGWPDKGFEVQVNNTHTDPKRTAGLYDVLDSYAAPAPDDEWFTLYIKVEGNHVITKVNDRVIVEWTQPDGFVSPKGHASRIIDHGTFALQGHDPGSETHFKNIYVHALP
jgi:hypothetical protein